MPGIEAYGRADWPIIAVQNSVLGLQPCPVRPLTYREPIRFETAGAQIDAMMPSAWVCQKRPSRNPPALTNPLETD
jgi:hypothetical protein